MELELRLTILAIGLIIIILIYLWGIRHRLRETWDERHRRRHNRYQNEPVMQKEDIKPVADGGNSFDRDETGLRTGLRTGPRTGSRSAPVSGHNHETWSGEDEDDDDHDYNDHQTKTDTSKAQQTLADRTDAIINADRHPPDYQESDNEQIHSDDEIPNIIIFIVAPKDKPFKGSDIVATMQAMELKLNSKGTWSYYQNTEIMNNPVFRVGHLKEPGVFDMKTIDTLETPGLMLFIQLPGPVEALAAVDRMIGKAAQMVEKLGGSICDDHLHKLTPQLISHLREQATEYDRRSRLPQSR